MSWWPFSKKSPYRESAEPPKQRVYCKGCKYLQDFCGQTPVCLATIVDYTEHPVSGRKPLYQSAYYANVNYDCSKREDAE